MSRSRTCSLVVLMAVLATSSPVHAQWSEDPAASLVLADRSGAQVQPKIVATTDGGFYVSWFDNSTSGYDVYVQRLDAAGNEQWPHNGVPVADRAFSSTQDYGLAVDTMGNALLAFRDHYGNPPTIVEVKAAKVDPAGTLVWGTAGIQVSSAGGFVAAPKVAGTSDGNLVVAWTHESDVRVQKLDAAGTPLWGPGLTYSTGTGSFAVSDLHAADAGTAIVSFIHPTGSFGSPIHLWAQKLAAADGASLWDSGHVQVYDEVGGSLQFGNFPPFITDGAGGAVFAWYTNSPSLQSRVQRVLSNGSEAFAHQGIEVSTNASRIRVSPSAAFVPASQEIYVFWAEENIAQSQFGLYAQKVDATGARQWTDNGLEVLPLGANQLTDIVTLSFGNGAVAVWSESVSFGNEPIHATRVDGTGAAVWSPAIVDLASSATGTFRIAGAVGALGYAAYAWQDGTSDEDILAQNLNPDGQLGPLVFSDGFESGDTAAWTITVGLKVERYSCPSGTVTPRDERVALWPPSPSSTPWPRATHRSLR